DAFLENNDKAKIYIHEKAFENYYSMGVNNEFKYIGINKDLKQEEQIVLTKDYLEIDEGIEQFAGVTGRELFSQANSSIFMEANGIRKEDIFEHEQNLILTEEGKTLLLAGCAHNGIVNIVNKFKEIKGFEPNYVIGGFHLYNPNTKKSENEDLISEIAKYLLKTKSLYYTGHCTGLEAYNRLKELMGDRIEYLSTGSVLEI
ncbi:MAG: MBL fold metallo-hydrolase, partial [Clostridiales bacterium]|nr:MBL fold metallo-hydrolase [Clostridiales bacterium]